MPLSVCASAFVCAPVPSVHCQALCACICLTAEMQRGRNHTCDVLWADLMERHCTIHISKNAWRCLSWCSSSATSAANSVAEYVHVHILHSTNLIHPLLFFFALSLSLALSNRLVLGCAALLTTDSFTVTKVIY